MESYSNSSWQISLKLLKSAPRIIASTLWQELVTASQKVRSFSNFVGSREVLYIEVIVMNRRSKCVPTLYYMKNEE